MSGGNRILPVLVVLVVTAVAGLSGFVLPSQSPAPPAQRPVVLGRQLTVCPVQPGDGRASRLGAVVADGVAPGRLVGSPLGADRAVVELDAPGTADQIDVGKTVVLRTEQGFNAGSAGAVLTTARTGGAQGISLAGCLAPGTEHWLTGVAANATQSTRLVLTNPDTTQAEIDLHFFGADGPIGAPGSLGLVVPGSSSAEVSLTGLLPAGVRGPVAVQVGTSRGRISAYAQSTYRDSLQPAGDGWAAPMPTPQTSVVIPGIPGGAGTRELVLANPTARRTQVRVEVLGADGTFAPADNATVDVNAQSTGAVRLDGALDGEAVALRLTSDQPVTAAAVATSSRRDAAADVAVQTPAAPIRGLGLHAYAFGPDLDGRLVLSNAGDQPATVEVDVRTFDLAGQPVDPLTLAAGTTAVVELPDAAGGFVAVRTASTTVYAGVVLSQPSGSVAGLATGALSSPAAIAGGGQVSMDPRAGTR